MDQLQTSFIREYIKNESKRGYDHKSIYIGFQNKFDLSKVGAKYLTNAKVTQYTQFSRRVQQFGNFQTFLESRNCKFEFHLSLAGMVVVFANCSLIHQLITCGNELVLMDACGSLAGNFLVTLLIRNNLRCWIPWRQFWISKEHSDLYSFALDVESVGSYCVLIDGSKIESKAIESVFGNTRVLAQVY